MLRLGALAALDAFALWFLIQLISDKVWFLALAIGVVTLGLNVFFLREDLYPFRWFSPGLALMIIMVAYPTIFTIYVAFTNYRDGNLLRQYQVIDQIEREQFLPEGAMLYSWTAYQNQDGTLGLWLVGDDGQTIRFVSEDGAVRDVDLADPDLGELDDKGIPASVGDYQKLSVFNVPSDIQTRTFGDSEEPYKVTTPYKAGHYEQRYVYSAADETMTDQQTGTVYTAVQGTFTSPEGETLKPGYYVTIGLDNFKRLVNSRAIRGPFIQVFAWTIAHAFLTVLLTFALGLGLALVLNDPIIPVRKIFRSLILIPYAIPAFISVLVWRGLLNPELGVISTTLRDIFGSAPAWFADPTWAKVGILLIQLWLGFPYMMIICTGALQSIPSDIYEAAEVDGANPWQRFWNITLPLLLISVGPLLIASFAFNFNNFTIIRLYAKGGPPIPDTTTPAGHTDILITYTYRLAFASQRGADYGFATSITIVIFLLVAAITFFNFRFTRVWEEVSESV
ncbi:MAG: maltose ABC transporter permease MalF [Anaerolineae bacterium]|nr:maltose ABC transporter permease MalF [Anaerolineae bacterium]